MDQSRPDEDFAEPDSVEKFIADLAALKARHPSMSYKAMEAKSTRLGLFVGKTSLNNAAKQGQPLPSERTVNAFVSTLTDDRAQARQWCMRRNALEPAGSTGAQATAVAPLSGDLRPKRLRSWHIWAAALVATNILTGLVVAWVVSGPADDDRVAEVMTGADPADTHCIEDAVVAAATPPNPTYTVEVMFSAACDAAWGRIERVDNAGMNNRVTVTIFQRSNPDGSTRQEAIEPDVDSAYTNLIVRADGKDRLCVSGSATTDGVTVATEQAVCT